MIKISRNVSSASGVIIFAYFKIFGHLFSSFFCKILETLDNHISGTEKILRMN